MSRSQVLSLWFAEWGGKNQHQDFWADIPHCVLCEVPRPPTLFPATSMTWAAFSTSSRACSISTRDRAMSARTVPCSTRGFPKATRDFACGHRRQDGRHGRCPAEERVGAQEGAAGEARHMAAAQSICTTPLHQPFCPIWAGLASRQYRA